MADRSKCFCRMKLKGLNATNKFDEDRSWIFRSVSRSHRGSHVTGEVCLSQDSPKICDGVEDCVGGKDESPETCGKNDSKLRSSSRREPKAIRDVQKEEGFFNFGYAILGGVTAFLVGLYFAGCFIFFKVRTRKKSSENNDDLTSTSELVVVSQERSGVVNEGAAREEHSTSSGYWTVANSHSSVNDDSIGLPTNPNWSWNGARLVRELGRGQQGTVYLAEELSGRLVAVKGRQPVIRGLSNRYFDNEVKVLTGLGRRHPNVIKLVGFNRERQLLALEFCHNGSLKQYLKDNKASFIDEIDPATGEISSALGTDRTPSVTKLPMSDFLVSLHTKLEPDNQCQSSVSGYSTLRSRDEGDRHILNTRRLLRWARQVSQGMEFLVSRGVSHGDLALRNTLLTFSDIVKITDFGLARREPGFQQDAAVNEGTSAYIRCGAIIADEDANEAFEMEEILDRPLPVAWLAPERFQDPEIQSELTDVWSFGVLLWEMFSLGENPYSDQNLECLGRWLRDGNRMTRPLHAPGSIYNLATDCWNADPKDRPSFSALVSRLVGMRKKRSDIYATVTATETNHDLRSSKLVRSCLDLMREEESGSPCQRSPTHSALKLTSEASMDGYIPMGSNMTMETHLSEYPGNKVCYWNGYKILKRQQQC